MNTLTEPDEPAQPTNLSKQALLVLAFVGVYILWGSTYFAIKILVHTVPVFLMAATRFLLAGAIMVAWGALGKQPLPSRQQTMRAAMSGFLLLVMGNATMLFANRYISSSGVIAVIVSITPLWMVLLQWLWKKGERPGWAVWLGIAFGMLGMYFMAGPKNSGTLGPGSWIGIALVVAGTIFWAIGTIYAKGGFLPASPAYNSAIQMLTASCITGLLGSLNGEWPNIHLGLYGVAELWSFLYLVLGGSVLGFTAYTYINKNASASSVSTYAYVNPVIALLLGWGLGNEVISNQTLIACTLLIMGVILIVIKPEWKQAKT